MKVYQENHEKAKIKKHRPFAGVINIINCPLSNQIFP